MKNKIINKKEEIKKEIPIIFAIDDNYAPFLCVTLQSITANANKNNLYKIVVLNEKLSYESKMEIMKYNVNNFTIQFLNVTENLKKFENKLSLRDYYTKSTYYRFLIPDMLKEYNKALYLDCDIIVLNDVANLYDIDLHDNYVGAISDDVVVTNETFSNFTEQALGISRFNYFNAGILSMNLKKFREINLEQKFATLLSKYTFKVAQDQDYLNVICKNKVKYIDLSWNKAPIKTEYYNKTPYLIHYKLSFKPWHYDNVLYGNYFWKYAKQTSVYGQILEMRKAHTEVKKEQEKINFQKLLEIASIDSNSMFNYRRLSEKEG